MVPSRNDLLTTHPEVSKNNHVNYYCIKSLADIGLSGQFVFNELFLDNSVLTTAGNNDEISVILAKKDSDTRYGKLTENIKVWVRYYGCMKFAV